jgi:magnesium chelatase family protein
MGLVPPGRGLLSERPFRSPHHSVSDAGLMGGGSYPRPGEISLAHNGVLFLDELPEFKRHVLELLRQPLEEGRATITRARSSVEFPARFLLAAAMNPCPCGYLGHMSRACTCTPNQVRHYQGRLSGPLLDRIDLYIELAALKPEELVSAGRPAEASSSVRERVSQARAVQAERLSGEGMCMNAHMRLPQVQHFCSLKPAVKKTVFAFLKEDQLSARGYHRMLKVARTIADLAGKETIGVEHVLEAYQYRCIGIGKI